MLGVLYVPHAEKRIVADAIVKNEAWGETENLGRCEGRGAEGKEDYAAAARLRLGLEDRRQARGAAA